MTWLLGPKTSSIVRTVVRLEVNVKLCAFRLSRVTRRLRKLCAGPLSCVQLQWGTVLISLKVHAAEPQTGGPMVLAPPLLIGSLRMSRAPNSATVYFSKAPCYSCEVAFCVV